MENQSPTAAIEPVVNKKMPDGEVWKALDDYCSGLGKLLATAVRVRQVVGQLLIEVRSRRLYEQKGFKSFDAFLTKELEEKYGMSRASAYNSIWTVETLPDLSLQQAERLGAQKVLYIAKAVKHVKGTPAEKKRLEVRLLQRAEKLTCPKLQDLLEKDGLWHNSNNGPKPGPRSLITIKAGKRLMAAWKKAVGEDDPAEVLWRLLRGVRVKTAPHFKKAA